MKNQKYKHGLSLIEILMAVIIIAILATMVITVASSVDNRSKEEATRAEFSLLETALQEYREFKGFFPEQPVKDSTDIMVVAAHSEFLYGELYSIPDSQRILEKINASLIKHKFDTGLMPPVPEIYDPWGIVIDYSYAPEDTFPELVSAGPDRIFGNGDDITSK